MSWRDDAACAGTDTAWWFPNDRSQYDLAGKAEALRLCGVCPVAAECLRDALDEGALQFGIRAGLTADERERLPRSFRRRVNAAECGTDSGYNAHRRRGEATCSECRAAHAAAQARQRPSVESGTRKSRAKSA